jgi:hypothetical protein
VDSDIGEKVSMGCGILFEQKVDLEINFAACTPRVDPITLICL